MSSEQFHRAVRAKTPTLPVVDVYNFIEQKRSARRAPEPGADEFVVITQVHIARGAGIQTAAAQVSEEQATHGR